MCPCLRANFEGHFELHGGVNFLENLCICVRSRHEVTKGMRLSCDAVVLSEQKKTPVCFPIIACDSVSRSSKKEKKGRIVPY